MRSWPKKYVESTMKFLNGSFLTNLSQARYESENAKSVAPVGIKVRA